MTSETKTPTALHPTSAGRQTVWPALVIAAILLTTVLALRYEGRLWTCECGGWQVWKGDVWSSHCSQHVLDPYSITHMSHGLIFWCVMLWLLPKMSVAWRLVIAVGIAAAWEVAENSAFVINRYRSVTMSLDYMGDSVLNATADVMCCFVGFFVARALGPMRTLALFVLTETMLLFTMRDNLTLNVIMLVWPIEAIKTWQSMGK